MSCLCGACPSCYPGIDEFMEPPEEYRFPEQPWDLEEVPFEEAPVEAFLERPYDEEDRYVEEATWNHSR